MTCSETCSTSAAMPIEGAADCPSASSFQLFAIWRLFRNQQVAGSIPAGGSMLSVI
jgi:hypothetical protein